MSTDTHYDTLVIGGGQAGLSVGYQLKKSGQRFLILDAHRRVGDAWRKRWDSLMLFTPSHYNELPGLPFPAPRGSVVSKDQMADYLATYAEHFELPVRCGARVERLFKRGERFVVRMEDAELTADQVVVAMANYQVAKVPDFAEELDPATFQLHSKHYRNPEQLRAGSVLVVGGGNSAADLALELSSTHETTMAGTETGHIPFRIEPWIARHLLVSLVRLLAHFVLNTRTPVGRKVRRVMLKAASPLVRVKPQDLVDAGVARTPRVVGVVDGRPLLADGRTVTVDNVVWCTGFRSGFSWIELPALDADGAPRHDRGVVAEVPGLYFVGLHFQFAATSATVTGVSRDARFVVRALLARARRARTVPGALLGAHGSSGA